MNESLTDDCFPDPVLSNTKVQESSIEKLLKRRLPKSDSKDLEKDLQYNFVLDKYSQNKVERPLKVKRKFMTRKERQELNLLKLSKEGWNYNSFKRIRIFWKNYMRENLDLIKKAPNYRDPDWANFSAVVAKSELIGAEITVIRSKVPSQVGISGTLVLETKMTFQLVTRDSKLKTILKQTAVFEFRLDDMKFTVFGKHLVTRPGERSVKKLKGHMVPDL